MQPDPTCATRLQGFALRESPLPPAVAGARSPHDLHYLHLRDSPKRALGVPNLPCRSKTDPTRPRPAETEPNIAPATCRSRSRLHRTSPAETDFAQLQPCSTNCRSHHVPNSPRRARPRTTVLRRDEERWAPSVPAETENERDALAPTWVSARGPSTATPKRSEPSPRSLAKPRRYRIPDSPKRVRTTPDVHAEATPAQCPRKLPKQPADTVPSVAHSRGPGRRLRSRRSDLTKPTRPCSALRNRTLRVRSPPKRARTRTR